MIDLRAFDRVTAEAETLGNGVAVVLLPQAEAESIVTVVCYRAGSRDESSGETGLAHFLEHMMFKGSALYPPGAIDSVTQGLGGTNNAFTSHDVSAYHFQFERRSWGEALLIEADRMRGLEPAAGGGRERARGHPRGDPDGRGRSLGRPGTGGGTARIFGAHPYGRPVLGTRQSLRGLDAASLGSFHRRHYRPGRAVLVAAGGLPSDAMERIEAAFPVWPAANTLRTPGSAGGAIRATREPSGRLSSGAQMARGRLARIRRSRVS